MKNWAITPLEKLADISSGGTPSRANDAFWNGVIPWVTPSDITKCKTNYLTDTQGFITDKGLSSSSAKLLPAGALLFTSRATIGEIKISAKSVTTNQGFKNLISNERIDSNFLFYQVIRLKNEFIKYAAGSTFLEINRKDLGRVRIPHPVDKCEQKNIARILQTIDQTIEKTEALIEKYQQIKAGLMHDLFTRGIGADGKLRPPREQALELYQQTPIGWIPKEWQLKVLEYGLSASPKNGFSPKEVENWQGLYVLGLSCLTKNGFKPIQLKNAPKNALLSGAKLEEGDFLISRSNTPELVGLCGVYRDVGHNAIYPDLMIKLKFNQNLVGDFLEKYLLSKAVRQRISAIAVGTSASMVKINSTTLKALKVIFPKPGEQVAIVKKLQPIENQISSLEVQNEKLRKQKSGLMHDLLTGERPVIVEPAEAVAHV